MRKCGWLDKQPRKIGRTNLHETRHVLSFMQIGPAIGYLSCRSNVLLPWGSPQAYLQWGAGWGMRGVCVGCMLRGAKCGARGVASVNASLQITRLSLFGTSWHLGKLVVATGSSINEKKTVFKFKLRRIGKAIDYRDIGRVKRGLKYNVQTMSLRVCSFGRNSS